MDMINTIDEIAYELMIKLMSSGMTNFMLFMSHLGSAITLIVLTIAFILLLKNKTNSKFIAINLVLVVLPLSVNLYFKYSSNVSSNSILLILFMLVIS